MDPRQIKTACATIVVILGALVLSSFLYSFREPPPALSTAPLSFDQSSAYRLVHDYVTAFPKRVLGSLESRQATGFIHDYLEQLGYPVSYIHFDARIARSKQVGRNVLAFKEGRNSEILALVAHMDTTQTTTQGAMDNGSGVAVLLELARIFSNVSTQRSLLFLFSDGEEWGMLGAGDLASNYADRERIAAVVSLDHVGIGELEAFCLGETGQLKGFSPPWLRHLAMRAAGSQGLPVRSSSAFSEYLERAILISQADQGPFLRVGIPAINLGSVSKDRPLEREIYHSARDTVENLRPGSIGVYGRAAELLARSLDELPSIPKQSPDAFRLWDDLFLGQGVVRVLQILLCVPPLLILYYLVRNCGGQLNLADAGREFLAFLATVAPFWSVSFLIELARALRLLPVYTLYPATLKDPVLESPAWDVLSGIFGTALFVAAVCYIIFRFSFQSLPKPDFCISKLVLLVLLLAVLVSSFFYNPYWATLFFILPAWIWAMVGRGRTPGARLRNRAMIVAAGILYYAVLWIYSSRSGMSWNFPWYHVLALSNGLFMKTAYFLATAVTAIGIRFLAIQSHQAGSRSSRTGPEA